MPGERSGRSYCVGDPIRVTVARVDLDDRKIDFVLPGASMDGGEKSGVARKGGKKPRGAATKTIAAGDEKSAAPKKKRRRSKNKKE